MLKLKLKSKEDLCMWNYSRQSYCIVMHNDQLEPYQAFFSPGKDVAADAADVLRALKDITKVPTTSMADLYLEDDDSVQNLIQKTSSLTLYKPEYLYFWIDNRDGTGTNMKFDMIYNVDIQTAKRFKYSPIPSRDFKEKLSSEAEWQERVTTQNFEQTFISTFEYPETGLATQVNMIHCISMDKYIAYLNVREASAIKYQVKTYFPDVRMGAPIISNIVADLANGEALVKYNADDVNFKKFQSSLFARNYSVRAIQSPELNQELTASKDTSFYNCNVLEAVIHMNYREHNENFVDLEKVFHMFPVSAEVPFSRLKSEKDTNYIIYRGSTDVTSPDFINKRTIQDWIDPKLTRLLDVTDVYAVSSLAYNRNVGRGLSFKILNYGDTPDTKRYMTLNIYKDGKIELKCFWDEQFGSDELNPGGNRHLIVEAVAKVRRFVQELNHLNYFVAGSSKKKITVPDADPFNPEGSTRIAFFNTISVFDYGEQLNYVDFAKYLDYYRAYIHLVTRVMPNNEIDTRSIELRYKRLNNYIHLKNIQRFIKNYKDENPQNNSETRADLRNSVAITFALSREDAEVVIADYEMTYENKRRRARKIVSKDDISRILNRDISTQSGIDIKIIKRQPKSLTDNTYKCLILGISYDMLGPVQHFLRHVIYYFKHHARLSGLPLDTNYLGKLLTIKDLTEEEVIKQGAAETIAEVKGATSRKPLIAPRAIGAEEVEDQEFEFELEDEPEQEPQMPEETPMLPVRESSVAPEEETAVKTAKTHAVTTMVSSFLDLLQARVKEVYSDNIKMSGEPTPYSTKCQKSEGRQPLVIPIDLANALKQYVNDKVRSLTEQEARETGAKLDDIKNQLFEYKIHQQTLERGMVYKPQAATTPYFYFCPLTWNMSVNTPDAVDQAFPAYDMNPQTKDAAKNKYLYMSPKRKFKAGFKGAYNKWTELMDGKRPVAPDPPHASYVRFIQNNADYSACRACCFVNNKDTPETAQCLGKSVIPMTTSSGTSVSYIKAEGKFVEANRFAFIPEKLNRIFNLDDEGLKLISSSNTTISTGFDYYLRKGVKDGKFLNAISELVPKIDNMVEYIEELLEEDLDLYTSLKKGAINQLFAPETLTANTELDTKISLQNFISYLQTNTNDINEDFLWDLLSRPDVILPTPSGTGVAGGLNIIICEVELAGKRSAEIDTGIIKCPVGFQINELFNPDRPSIVLYKYKDNYELICHVEENNRDIVSNPIFESGHPLVVDIISHLMTKCHTFPNIKAEQELRKHIDNIQKNGIVNRTLINRVELPDLHVAIRMLKSFNIKSYLGDQSPLMEQIVDKHHKVTHIKLTESHWLPIKPSGVSGKFISYNFSELTAEEMPDLVAMVRLCEELTTFENFDGYRPYAFLMDPGEDLEDPDDDIIIGLMLANGLICYTRPLTIMDFKVMDPVLVISHPDKSLDLEEHTFDMRQLLFSESELWYADYMKADKALAEQDRKLVDMRRIYSVRSSFEHESYQRLRYELSRLLQDVYPEIGQQLREIISQIPPSASGKAVKERADISTALMKLLTEGNHLLTQPSGDQLKTITDAVGPLDQGTEDIGLEDMKYSYSYNTPSVRYECFNRSLDKLRSKSDVHCMDGRLFINRTNLVTGKGRNLENYLARITEEILRIPIKRQEILEGQMNNFIYGIASVPSNAYLLGSENMIEDFKGMYQSRVNYREKMYNHYDNINPQNYTEFEYKADKQLQMEVSQRCAGKFVNLPTYWIGKFRNMSWKIYDITGAANCIYTELDTIIASATKLSVNTRLKIASIIDSDQFEGEGGRAGWQLALDYYSHLWRADYRQVKTKDELLESIKYSTRHKLSMLDLSLISRAYNIKFIVLAKPNRVNKSGIVCMNTTQAVGADVIVLYLQGLADFSVVKNVQFSPEKAVFKQSELPEVLQREWVQTCIRDHSESKDPANMLFRSAPLPAKTAAGHVVFTDTAGNLVPNPSIIRPKITLKPTAKVPGEPAVKEPEEAVKEPEEAVKEPELEESMAKLTIREQPTETTSLEGAMAGLTIRPKISFKAKLPVKPQEIPSISPDKQETRIPPKIKLTLKVKPKPVNP